MMMSQDFQERYAQIWSNPDFILVETCLGGLFRSQDPKAPQHFLSPDADEATIGAALVAALSRSRVISLAEVREFADAAAVGARYAAWVNHLMERHHYKSRRALFSQMKSVDVSQARPSSILLQPTLHDQLEGWGREKDDGIEDVTVFPTGVEDIGIAVRVALSRCR